MATASDELVCPACGSDHVNPARARGLDHLVMLIGSRPYVCGDCGERFRSTAPLPSEEAYPVESSESTAAVCPNCGYETTIHLTPGEQEMAVQDGWVVSCPGCRALFSFVRPTEMPKSP